MTTYPLPSLAATVDATGISAPAFEDILLSLQASFRSIYGSDVYLAPDSQDGQLLAIFARALYDANQTAIAVYNQFSPTTSQGAGLSSIVKINGLRRQAASNSTVELTLTGVAGTVVTNGSVADTVGNLWDLPASVVIGLAGTVLATATARNAGNVTAGIGAVTRIMTPTLGWQSVTNLAIAEPGIAVENDATLRQRQSVSTALPSQDTLSGIIGAVANLLGVGRYKGYENDTDTTDANGIPSHSISIVVEGGDAVAIATAIALKKTPGTGTYGALSEVIVDQQGIPATIRFYDLIETALDVTVNLTALPGYVSTTGDKIRAAIVAWLVSLDIGADSEIGDLWSAANLTGTAATGSSGLSQAQLDPLKKTYKVTSITQGLHGGAQAATDVVIAFNAASTSVLANVTVTVT